MGLFEGKKGLILGVANNKSIAWAIAEQVMQGGGECGFTHLPDPPHAEKPKNRLRVEKLTKDNPQAKFLIPLNVQDEDNLNTVMNRAGEEFGKIDFLLHSIAYAKTDDLSGDTINTSRDGFGLAMDISVFSLIAVCKAARPFFNERASVVTMSYFGGEKCVPGYNVMGICKAALEATTRYLAFDLGPEGVRVNAVSAGPVKTLSGSAAGVRDMLMFYDKVAPLGRNVEHEEVGRTGAFLLSEMSDGITAEVMHVDCGYNAMGSPGRLLEKP